MAIVNGENIGLTKNAAIITWEQSRGERYNPTILSEHDDAEAAADVIREQYEDSTTPVDVIYRDETSGDVLWYSGDEFEMKRYE